MSELDEIGFGEEAALLKQQAGRLLAERMPIDRLHAMVAGHDANRSGPPPWDESLWREMVDLGWSALALPESAGGIEMPLTAIAGLMEEIGRAALPGPLLDTLAVSLVLAEVGDTAQPAMTALAGGDAASLAICDRYGAWRAEDLDVEYRDGLLNGRAWHVQELSRVQHFLVAARNGDGLSLFWVDASADGVQLERDDIVDLTRDQGRVVFRNVVAMPLTLQGQSALDAAFPAIWTLLASEMAGASEWLLQTTVEYACTRQQFDRPLGWFQAVKHPLVNLMIKIDETRSLVFEAACAMDDGAEEARDLAHMAKASACDTAAFAANRSVQLHGGIGFTWECFVHVYFKRLLHGRSLWGGAQWHRARLAERVIGPLAA